ncbi:unnamed protein product, partial [Ectocarpus sp. 12 AP-2014]
EGCNVNRSKPATLCIRALIESESHEGKIVHRFTTERAVPKKGDRFWTYLPSRELAWDASASPPPPSCLSSNGAEYCMHTKATFVGVGVPGTRTNTALSRTSREFQSAGSCTTKLILLQNARLCS